MVGMDNGRHVEGEEKSKHKGKHDKPKPWDDETIDHWKIEKFDPSWNEGGMLEVSSFSTLFPQYREKYLQEVWPIVRQALEQYGISCELNLVDLQLESGEYFLSEKSKSTKKWQERQEKQSQKVAANKRKREAAFIPPQERTNLNSNQMEDIKSDVTAMARSLMQKTRALGTKRAAEYNAEPSSYIANT